MTAANVTLVPLVARIVLVPGLVVATPVGLAMLAPPFRVSAAATIASARVPDVRSAMAAVATVSVGPAVPGGNSQVLASGTRTVGPARPAAESVVRAVPDGSRVTETAA